MFHPFEHEIDERKDENSVMGALPTVHFQRVATRIRIFAKQSAARKREAIEETLWRRLAGLQNGTFVHVFESSGVQLAFGKGYPVELCTQILHTIR